MLDEVCVVILSAVKSNGAFSTDGVDETSLGGEESFSPMKKSAT
jgi:hypothetical protein